MTAQQHQTIPDHAMRAAVTQIVGRPLTPADNVLEVRRDASRDVIEANYRRLRSQHHPDRGGDADAFQRVQRAYEQASTR